WYGGRARRSVGQRTAGSKPPSRRPLGSEACLVDSYEGGQPPCTIPTKGAYPLREPPGGVPPPCGGAPGTHCSSDCNGWAPRTVVNNAGLRGSLELGGSGMGILVLLVPGHLDGFQNLFVRFLRIVSELRQRRDPCVHIGESYGERVGVRVLLDQSDRNLL